MATKPDNPYAALKTLFHEPNRLAIMSALTTVVEGLTFNDLKRECGLTDGNLSRHLKVLEEAGAIRIEKTFVGAKPRTTVFLSDAGRKSFIEYLQALEEVLKKAAESVAAGEKAVPKAKPWGRPVRA
ncbi:MAG: winged helix-turn-helix domain-containing protein [Candidatus Binatia bacterium]